MRLIKMLGLGMLACLATMAFVGATSASADSFCTTSGLHAGECAAANIYKGNMLGTSTKKALLLENKKIKEECDSQLLGLGSTIENEGAHKGVKILIDTGALNFTNCTGLCEKSENINSVWLLAEALTLDVWSEGDPNKPKAKLSSCLFGIECFYEFKNARQLSAVSGDTVTASEVGLERVAPSSGLCPNNNMSFDATWLVTKDETGGAPIFLAALP